MNQQIDLFPHSNFGYRLEFKDNAEKRICWFSHPSHVLKYIERYRIDKKSCKIDVHPNYPPLDADNKPVKKQKQLFANVDTYVKITEDKPKRSRKRTSKAAPAPIEAPPAPSRSARKAPKASTKGKTTEDCPKLLSDRFKAKKK